MCPESVAGGLADGERVSGASPSSARPVPREVPEVFSYLFKCWVAAKVSICLSRNDQLLALTGMNAEGFCTHF